LGSSNDLSADGKEALKEKITKNLKQTDQSLTWLDQNANVRLLVENLLISY